MMSARRQKHGYVTPSLSSLPSISPYISPRRLWLYGPASPRSSIPPSSQSSPSHRRSSSICSAYSALERCGSRSSIRRIHRRPDRRADNHDRRAVKTFPRCMRPEGEGANLAAPAEKSASITFIAQKYTFLSYLSGDKRRYFGRKCLNLHPS